MLKIRLKNNLIETRKRDVLKKINDPLIAQQFAEFQASEQIDPKLSNTRKFSEIYPSVVANCLKSGNVEKLKQFIEMTIKLFSSLDLQDKNTLAKIESIQEYDNFIRQVSNKLKLKNKKKYEQLIQQLKLGPYRIFADNPETQVLIFSPRVFRAAASVISGTSWCIGRDAEDWNDYAVSNKLLYVYFMGVLPNKFPRARAVIKVNDELDDIYDEEGYDEHITVYDYEDTSISIQQYIFSIKRDKEVFGFNTDEEVDSFFDTIISIFAKGQIYHEYEEDFREEEYEEDY